MSFYQMRQGQGGADDALYIDGVIAADESWFGPEGEVIARRFRSELNRLGNMTVYINSPGGEVSAAAEIYTALKEHQGTVTVKITGIAASSAAMIAMAGDKVLISPVGTIMIHDPWTYAAGNAREFAQWADRLREIGEGLIHAYTEKTGKTRDEIAQLLAAETYMNAQTAVDEGFADAIMTFDDIKMPAPKTKDKTRAMMQMNRFGPAAVCAMLGGANPAPHHHHTIAPHAHTLPRPMPGGQTQEDDAEREERRSIADRAQTLASLYE